jgi:uncharacterized protein (DUF433 family)
MKAGIPAEKTGKERITIDPAVLCGKPVIRGLRISVEQILRALAAEIPQDEILRDYPELQPEDLRACMEYADLRDMAGLF